MNSQAQFWAQFTAVGMAAILGTYFLISLGNSITDLFRIYLAHRRARKFWDRAKINITWAEPTKESEKT